MIPRILITPGEPAGIGPDLVADLVKKPFVAETAEIVVVADKNLLQHRFAQLGVEFTFKTFEAGMPDIPSMPRTPGIKLKHIPAAHIHCVGKPVTANAEYILKTLDYSTQLCLSQNADALVTGPVNKAIINEAGFNFTGHTEYLAHLAKVDKTLMLFETPTMRVALATTHVPLREVANQINPSTLQQIIQLLHAELQSKFKITQPKILVCGLNPHAGEQGYLGREEIDTIGPVIQQLQPLMNVQGPYAADTIFTPKYIHQCDCILAMYHDQALPVVKAKHFYQAANVTLGLPFLRTSVDHGTALDIAGSGRADASSLIFALETAIQRVQSYA